MGKNRLVWGLLYSMLMVLLGGLLIPVQAQEDLDTTLARATGRGFLTTLVRPELSDTRDFYLLEGVDITSLLEAFPNGVSSFTVVEADWVDSTVYQIEARLNPGNRRVLVTTGEHDGRWKVEAAELVLPPTPMPAATMSTTSTTTNTQQTAPPGPRPMDNGLFGLIAFQTYSGGDIYVIAVDGTGLRRVTHGIDPQLSPDGRKLTFTRWDPYYKLYTINTNGTEETEWAAHWRQMKSPSWSADGTRLVFSYQHGGRLHDRYVEYNPETVFKQGDRPPRIPPRGWVRDFEVDAATGRVSYKVLPDSYWHLQQVDLTTGEYIDTATGSRYSYGSTFHPTDPTKILFRGDKGLGMYNVQEKVTRRVSDNVGDKAGVISPNGQKIAFSFWQDGHWEIHTINVDGSNRQQITRTPMSVIANKQAAQQEVYINEEGYRTLRTTQPQGQPNANWHWDNAAPTWSPDGRHILFMTNRSGQWEIWIMNADGSEQRPMFINGAVDHLSFEYAGVDERMLSWRVVQPPPQE